MVPQVPPVGGQIIPQIAVMVVIFAAIPALIGVLLTWGGSKAKAKPAQMVGWLLILAASLGLVWYFGTGIFERAPVNGALWLLLVDLKMLGSGLGQLQLPADFAGVLSLWPLALVVVAAVLFVGFARWVLNATRAPAKTREGGEGAGGFLGGLDILRLAESLLALAVIVVVAVALGRQFGIGIPSLGPDPVKQVFTLAANAIRKNPARVVASAEFLKRPELELGPITQTLTIAEAEVKVAMVDDELVRWGHLDQNATIEISQDARREVAEWVERLGRRLSRNGFNPFADVPGYTQLAVRASELEMRGQSTAGIKVWTFPPDEGGELQMVIGLIDPVARLRGRGESIDQRVRARSIPYITDKEITEAQALAVDLKAICVNNWNQLEAGKHLPIPKRYESLYLDMIYSPPGAPRTGLCDWTEFWTDRLQRVVVR